VKAATAKIVEVGCIYMGVIMSRNLSLVFVLFTSALLCQTGGECGGCGGDKKVVRIAPTMFRGFIKDHSFPTLVGQPGLPDAPMAFDLVVDQQGVPCSIVAMDWPGPAEIPAALSKAMSRWKFSGASINGDAACIRSKLFVAAKAENGRVLFSFTDPPK